MATNKNLIPPGPYRIMGVMETGEIARYHDRDWSSYEAAEEWVEANKDNYPESKLFIESAIFWNM